MTWDLYRDGISYSSLCKFMVCRERFRLYKVEGLKEKKGFQAPIEYGNLLHDALEIHAQTGSLKKSLAAIRRVYTKLINRHSMERDEVKKWYELAKRQFPIYVDNWRKVDRKKKYIFWEEDFSHKYKLPYSGRVIPLFGRFDAGFQSGKAIYLQENKTKGAVDVEGLMQSGHKDLQTMYYLICLKQLYKNVRGCLYNVIKRPLSDLYSPRQKKSESLKEFHDRVAEVMDEKRDQYFKRFQIPVTNNDVKVFKQQTFDPLLETVADWWDSIKDDPLNPWGSPLHWVRPYGVYDPMTLGRRGDLFNLLTTGSRYGIVTCEQP